MVPVLRAEGTFHARVVAARLGSEGIVTQLRGNVDGPYPMGSVEVLVTPDDLAAPTAGLAAPPPGPALGGGGGAGVRGGGGGAGGGGAGPGAGGQLPAVAVRRGV